MASIGSKGDEIRWQIEQRHVQRLGENGIGGIYFATNVGIPAAASVEAMADAIYKRYGHR